MNVKYTILQSASNPVIKLVLETIDFREQVLHQLSVVVYSFVVMLQAIGKINRGEIDYSFCGWLSRSD